MTDSQYATELTHCIEEHNDAVKRAHEAWTQAQETASRIGRLVGTCLATGTSWAELGRLLAEVADQPPPEGLLRRKPPAPVSFLPPVLSPTPTPARVPTQPSTTSSTRSVDVKTREGVPHLLARAYAVVRALPEKEIASRDLAVALNHNPNTIGPDLCALLREVGVIRPSRGRIKARYEGASARLPGFTEPCLKRAVEAYAERHIAESGAASSPTPADR
ncbi:hypothetical protein ACPYPE_23650 [Streptomyces griseus]|uniref:hypothetical protein n=1 Tax=Streptomyces griseus TaxID=1911 RepID=UPI003CF3558B